MSALAECGARLSCPPPPDISATSAAIGGQLPTREDIGDRTNRLRRWSRAVYAWSGTPTTGRVVVLAP